jgi:hypothetical protein
MGKELVLAFRRSFREKLYIYNTCYFVNQYSIVKERRESKMKGRRLTGRNGWGKEAAAHLYKCHSEYYGFLWMAYSKNRKLIGEVEVEGSSVINIVDQ